MQHPCGALPSGRRRRGRYLPHPPRCCYLGTRCARGGDGAAGPAATAWPVSYGRGSWPPPSRARQYANLFREQAFASRSIPVHFHQLIHDAMRRASLLALLRICASAERHRVLRSQGLVQQIIDAILVLDIDDPPCAIATGALLFVLASDRFRFSLVMQSPPSTC
ncbi:uncharacterized protein [Miscanthus floridulus]|uniref:uncharacterized protein isoform X3 n=1 Tax=Miscanthus floridulus TaxID=154761 RepID=UPI00345997A5